MNNEHLYPYVDGVGGLSMVDGVVRMDLVVITEIEGEQMKAQRVGGIATFINAVVKLRDQLNAMVK
jgi:hypothetical protein